MTRTSFGRTEQNKKRTRRRGAQVRGAEPLPVGTDVIKLRLDPRTVITCKRKNLPFWYSRYPNAEVLS